jgi:hypothetical protein
LATAPKGCGRGDQLACSKITTKAHIDVVEFCANSGRAGQFRGVFTGPKTLRRPVATMPVADADVALSGRRVPWFQEWTRHG